MPVAQWLSGQKKCALQLYTALQYYAQVEEHLEGFWSIVERHSAPSMWVQLPLVGAILRPCNVTALALRRSHALLEADIICMVKVRFIKRVELARGGLVTNMAKS